MRMLLSDAIATAEARGIAPETAQQRLMALLASGEIEAEATAYLVYTSTDEGVPDPSDDVDAFREAMTLAGRIGATIGATERSSRFVKLSRDFWHHVQREEAEGFVVWDGSWARYVETPYAKAWPPKRGDLHMANDITLSRADVDRALPASTAAANDRWGGGSIATETRAAHRLSEMFQSAPPRSKAHARDLLQAEFPDLSGKGFQRIWDASAPPEARKAGAKPKAEG